MRKLAVGWVGRRPRRGHPLPWALKPILGSVLSLLLLVTPGPGASVAGSEGVPSPRGGVVIHAGRVLDVEAGSYLGESLIHVEEGVIRAVTPVATGTPIPDGAIDLSRHTLLPGLIDAHTHLCDNSYLNEGWDWWTLPAPAFGIAGAANAKTTLRAGFTTVRNVSDPFFCGVALRDAVAEGWVEGPTILASGPMISMTGGHGAPGNWMAPQHVLASRPGAVADGVDEVRKQARTHLKHSVDLLKIAATGGFGSHGTIPGASAYTVEEMRAAVDEAGNLGLAVAAHAHGSEGIRNAVAAGVRSIEHGFLMDDAAIEAMGQADTYLVPDLLAAHYDLVEVNTDYGDKELSSSNAEEYEGYAERVARAFRAGVAIAYGTDSSVFPHGRNGEQFALMVVAGIPPADALRSATVVAARLLGLEESVGTVEPGKQADLVAIEGDVLADPSLLESVPWVMRQGRVVKDETATAERPPPAER